MKKYTLIGAGGHAKAIVETIQAAGDAIAEYVDPVEADWLCVPWVTDDSAPHEHMNIALGVGGIAPNLLFQRLNLLENYLARGYSAPPIIHVDARVSTSAELESGVVVLAGAIIQPAARVSKGVIVNTAAVVEHDCVIEPGVHIAPGAIVLGGCRIGMCAMIGAGAVILPAATVPARSTVPALTRYSN